MSSELINMIHSRMNIDTNSNNTNNNHENYENTDNEWSVHNPEARTVFQELRMKLKDISALPAPFPVPVLRADAALPTAR